MKRGWFLILALSLGLNAGLLYMTLIARDDAPLPPWAPPGEPPLPGDVLPEEALPADAGGPGVREELPGGDAHPGRGRFGRQMAHDRLERLAHRLALGPEQQERIRAILDEQLPRMVSGRDSVRAARRAVHDAYLEHPVDPARVRSGVLRLSAAQARLDSLTAETILRELAVLTDEQRGDYFEAMPWARHMGPARRYAHGP